MGKLYAGIDLHSNNNYLCIIDKSDKRLREVKLENNLRAVLLALSPYEKDLVGTVVESRFNWYWLIDGLMEAGYQVHLANPAKNVQYSGLKHSNDKYDAFWLAHLLRLNNWRKVIFIRKKSARSDRNNPRLKRHVRNRRD